MKEVNEILKLVGDLGTPVVLLFIFVFYFAKQQNEHAKLLQNIEKQLTRIYEILKISNNIKDDNE